MSMPRRAMEQMGFSICCLTCDAPDIAGSKRCRGCIESHTRARDRMSGQATSKADRLSRELVAMLASPASYIDDTEHGELMLHYVTLISEHQGTVSAKTQEEIDAIVPSDKDIYPGKYRDAPIQDNLERFENMRKGKYPPGHCTLRMKMDLP